MLPETTNVLFALPWGERIILGTTDTDYAGPLDSPEADAADIQYILDIANRNFPSANLAPNDIINTYAGLRPLIADPSNKPSDISRRHEIRMTEPGWFDVAGGKLTTYRLMAEQTIDRIVDFTKIDARPCTTAQTPLLPEAQIHFSGIFPPPVSREAVEHFCRNEWAVNLDDIMVRRTSWRYYHPNHREIADSAANWMADA